MRELLLPGDLVEILRPHELAARLDADGALDGLPFMPEMLPFCGRRFRVAMRAERTCVHPPQGSHRRLESAVALEGLRCDGSAHGGCQLGCTFFWKEAWLRKVEPAEAAAPPPPELGATEQPLALRVTQPSDPSLHVCQGTELPRATTPGDPLWKPAQYLRFLRVRTFTLGELAAMLAGPGLRWLSRALRPRAPRNAAAPPPPLGLVPGEWVQVKTKDEILATLDAQRKLRGLAFSGEMYASCGRSMRVERRVERIIDETTGRMRPVADTVMLEGARCEKYLGCARGMPLMWREAWLRRVEAPAALPVPGACGSPDAQRSCSR